MGPPDACATAEDIAAHLAEIEDRSSYMVPAHSWDELNRIGKLHRERLG